MLKEVAVAFFKVLSRCVWKDRKTTRTLQHGVCAGQESKKAPYEYKWRVLPIHQSVGPLYVNIEIYQSPHKRPSLIKYRDALKVVGLVPAVIVV